VDAGEAGGEPHDGGGDAGGLGCVAAFAWMLEAVPGGGFCEGILVVDPLTQLIKQVLLVLTVFTAVIAAEGDFTEHVGEFFALLLFATAAMMFLVSSEDLLMISSRWR